VLDGKKLAAFSAAAGRFLRFPIGDRRGTRMRASASNRVGNGPEGRNCQVMATLAIPERKFHKRNNGR